MDNFNNQIISLIRTIVPVIVGQVMMWAAAQGIVDSTGQISALLITGLTVLFTAIYYWVIRFLETQVSSKFGWFLGVPKSPKYTK